MDAITAVDFGFRHASRRLPALAGVNFAIPAGQRVMLLGESGAGKSTLLMAIAGLLADDQGANVGSLQINGTVGMVLQDPDSQVIASRVGDDVAFGCENLNVEREEIWRRVPWALEMVGLDVPREHPTVALSGGQKQRLALAGVIAMGADIILLDEPTANLDPAGVREVVEAVTAVADRTGATVIVVEHRVGVWSDFAQRAIVLGHNGVLADGDCETVIATKGATLAAEGVWVPGIEPVFAPRATVGRRKAIAEAGGGAIGEEAAIEYHDLVCGWEDGRAVAPAASGRILRGASTVVTGRNGAGKSTFMLTLAGLLEPLSGEISYASSIAAGLDPHPFRWGSKQLASRIGYVFQDPEHQFVSTTVAKELEVGPRHAGARANRKHRRREAPLAAEDQARIDDLVARLGLQGLEEANPFELSGGQKRRLSVATVLVTAPKVVFLDEPTFGQDRRTFIELVNLVRELNDSGVTVISVTHDETYVKALGDEVITL